MNIQEGSLIHLRSGVKAPFGWTLPKHAIFDGTVPGTNLCKLRYLNAVGERNVTLVYRDQMKRWYSLVEEEDDLPI